MNQAPRTLFILDSVPERREEYRLFVNEHLYSYTIVEASLEEGLSLLQLQPDVILVGYPLTELDDQVFLLQLQRLTQRSGSPVILLIDQGREAIAAPAIAAGAQAYLLKQQLNAEALRIAIDLTMTNSRLRQQLQQSQAALQASEERLTSTLEATRTGVWEWNIQTGQLQGSENLEPMFGLQSAERDSEGHLLGYVDPVTDITARKQFEKALQDSEQQFRQLAENIDAVFWIRDAVAQRVIYVSPAYKRVWGLNSQDLYDDPQIWVNYIHPDDRVATDRAFREKALSGQFDQQYRIILPDGQVRWVHDRCFPLYGETGEIYRLTGIAEDITDRKQAEAQLRESEERLQMALDATQMGVWDWHLNTNEIIWSPHHETLLGYEPGTPYRTYSEWAQRVHPDDLERVEATIRQAMTHCQSYRCEYRVIWTDGSIHWLEAIGRCIYDAKGQPTRMHGILHEISDRKQAELALRHSEERFRTAVETMLDCFAVYRAVRNQHGEIVDFQAEYINDAACRMSQIPKEQHLSRGLCELLPSHRDSGLFAEYCQVVKTGQPLVKDSMNYEDEFGQQRLTKAFDIRVAKFGDGYIATWRDITDRKQAEQRLQDSEERLRLGMQVSGFAIARFDYTSDTVELSSEAARLYGLPTDSLVLPRTQFHATFHPEDRAELIQLIQQVLDPGGSGWLAREHRIVWTNGEVRWLSIRKQVFFDPLSHPSKPTHAVLVALDITDRKRAEAELQESEQLLRLALTGARQGIWDWDLEAEVLTWDLRCKEIFGLPSNFPVSYEWHIEALHPDDRQRVQETAAIALRDHAEFVEEYRTVHPDGTLHWVLARGCGFYDTAGKPCRMSGTVMDVTERKQAEIDLQERTAHVQLLYETTRDLLSTEQPLTLIQSVFEDLKTLIGLDVYLTYMLDNQQQKLHLICYDGISTEETQELTWLDIGATICGTVAQQRRQIMQANLQQSTDPKAKLVRAIGLTAYCCQPLIAQDKLYGTLSFGSRSRLEFTPSEQSLFQAICDQIAIALERADLFSSLQQQTEELIRANRIKDEFLAVLSHELRSPLNPILGWARLLQTRTFDAARTADALATIERNARLQTQLIDDLLDVAKILRGKLTLETVAVDLVFVVEAAIDTVRAAAVAKNIDLHPILPQIGRVAGDATRLQQVVWNLLSNAIKFTPSNGRVEIRLAYVEEQAQITVSDTGKGIRSDFLPYIFESFRQEDATTTRQHGGLGLGLSIVRHLVEAHGGTIRADSPGDGMGATFTIQLPLLEPAAHSNQSEEWLEPDLDLTGVRVLAVDDEPDARELLVALLTQYGAEVLMVNSAVKVLENLDTFQPDVLISDIGMPYMDGFSLIQHIRALPPEKGGQVPAIALTAYARREDYRRAIANGYQRQIVKPLDPEQLVRAVMELYPVEQ